MIEEYAEDLRELQIAEVSKLKSKALRVSRRRSDMVVSTAPAHAPSEAAKRPFNFAEIETFLLFYFVATPAPAKNAGE